MQVLQNRSHLRVVGQAVYLSPLPRSTTGRLVHCGERIDRVQHRHSPQLRQLPVLLHVLVQDLHVRPDAMEQLRDLLQPKQLASHIGVVHRNLYDSAATGSRTADVHDVPVHVLQERVDRLLIASGLRELRVQQRDFRGRRVLRVLELLEMLVPEAVKRRLD